MTVRESAVEFGDYISKLALKFSHADALACLHWLLDVDANEAVQYEKLEELAQKSLYDAMVKCDEACKTNGDVLFSLLIMHTSLTLTIVNQLETAKLHSEIDKIEEGE